MSADAASDAVPVASAPPGGSAPIAAATRTADDLRVSAVLAGALALLGALLGLVWSWWSPPGSAAAVLGDGVFQVIEESENHIAGDGRFLVIATVVGLVAAIVAWFGLRRHRGSLVQVGLAVGGLAGALLTEFVGHLTGGGSFTGKVYRLADGSTQEFTRQLPLSLHMQGLLFVEPALAVLGYGLFVAFAVRDDLGRPDPRRDALRASAGPSVDPGADPQRGRRHGDAPGALQQGDLPPE